MADPWNNLDAKPDNFRSLNGFLIFSVNVIYLISLFISKFYLAVFILYVLMCVIMHNFSFRQTAAKTWNSLPDDVRLADKLETFRSRLKTHLYRLSYC